MTRSNWGTFCEGDFFGEFAMLTGRDSRAHVRAVTPVTALCLTEEQIGEVAGEDPQIWDTLWGVYQRRMLTNTMASDALFGHLRLAQRDALVGRFGLKEYSPDEVIMRADSACEGVCMVLFGQVEIAPVNPRLPAYVVKEREFFGFVASLSDGPCRANVRALQDTTLLCLAPSYFRELTRSQPAIAGEIRHMLRERVERDDLFLTSRRAARLIDRPIARQSA